MLEDQYSFAFL